jgi:hypothetical protein
MTGVPTLFFVGTRGAPAWLCTESILAFFGPGSQCELQKAFRQQLREAAAMGRWETDWKAQVNYTVFLGSAEFVAQMRKLLRGDRDQQTGVRRGALEALTWTQIVQAVSNVRNEPWEKLLSARGTGARQTALFIGRIGGRLSLKELGHWQAGSITTLSVSPFVVSPNASRAIAPSLKRFRLSRRN